MRILICGAGVIGSLYGALLSEAGHDVSVLARGRRLEALRRDGLRYKTRGGIRTAKVNVLSRLEAEDRYDYVLVTVREHQLHDALGALRGNASETLVTMVNTLETARQMEALCGARRVLPAFPGAGGGFDGDVLDAALTPRFIQPTTLSGADERGRRLAAILRRARIPCQTVKDMHVWQICHLALVVPLADAYYQSADPARAGEDRALMRRTAARIRKNLRGVARREHAISPRKLRLFCLLPPVWVGFILGFVYKSRFGDRFMYRHAMKAPDEMNRLHAQLDAYLEE